MGEWAADVRRLIGVMDARAARRASERPVNGSEKFSAGRVEQSSRQFFRLPPSAGPRPNADSIGDVLTGVEEPSARWGKGKRQPQARWQGEALFPRQPLPAAQVRRVGCNDNRHAASLCAVAATRNFAEASACCAASIVRIRSLTRASDSIF